MILGPSGQPITVTEPVNLSRPEPKYKVPRQLRRAYARVSALSVINQQLAWRTGLGYHASRRSRREMAFLRAKRPAFIEEIRKASNAW